MPSGGGIHAINMTYGIQFAEQPRNRNTAYSRPMRFDMICEANGIEHTRTDSPMPLSCFESIFRASHLGQRLKPQKQAGHMNASNRPHSPNTTIASTGPSTYVVWTL